MLGQGIPLKVIAAAILLSLAVAAASALTISTCGLIDRQQECVSFWNFENGGSYLLPDTLSLPWPAIYHVTGESPDTLKPCGGFPFWAYLRDVVVEPCVPTDVGCGRIRHINDGENDCYVWSSIAGQGDYLIADPGGFAVGDTVRLTGVPCPGCAIVPGTCADYGGAMFEVRLSACPDTNTPVLPTSWGRIKAGYHE